MVVLAKALWCPDLGRAHVGHLALMPSHIP